MFPNRYDLSVNEARVEISSSDQPRIVTGTTLNSAGAFTGGGTGNKAILGFKGHSGLLVSAIASLQWEWEAIAPTETTGTPFFFVYPYVNLILKLDATPNYKLISIDPNENARQPTLNQGVLTNLGGSIFRFTHSAATNNMQVINAFSAQVAAGIVPAMPIVSAASPSPGVPVPWAVYTGAGAASWNNYAFTWAALLATYPNAELIDVYTGDGGLPGPSGTNTPTPSTLLCVGDSSFRRQRNILLRSMLINGSNA